MKNKQEYEIKFWKDWLEADSLKRPELVKKLPILKWAKDIHKIKKGKELFASFINGYFEDLENAVYTKINIEKSKVKEKRKMV